MGSKPLIGILALLLWIDGLSAQTFEIQLDPTEEGCSEWTGIYKDADTGKCRRRVSATACFKMAIGDTLWTA